jgi:hypothetical protein
MFNSPVHLIFIGGADGGGDGGRHDDALTARLSPRSRAEHANRARAHTSKSPLLPLRVRSDERAYLVQSPPRHQERTSRASSLVEVGRCAAHRQPIPCSGPAIPCKLQSNSLF